MDQRTARRQPAPRLRTNLDTDFLKLIAILSMLLDHIGAVFFPEHPAFRWVGRLAFPIFCYCMTVGLLYTRDIKRYLGPAGPLCSHLPALLHPGHPPLGLADGVDELEHLLHSVPQSAGHVGLPDAAVVALCRSISVRQPLQF